MFQVKSQMKNYLITFDSAIIELSNTAYKLYNFLLKVSIKNNESYYSIERIRNLKYKNKHIISSNRNVIIKAFKELEELKYIKITRRKAKSNLIEVFIKDELNLFDIIKQNSSIRSDTSSSIKSDTSSSIRSDTVSSNILNNNNKHVDYKERYEKLKDNVSIKDENEEKEKILVGGLESLDKEKYRIDDFKRFLDREIKKNKNIRNLERYTLKLIMLYKKDFRKTNDKVYIPHDENDLHEKIKDEISDKEFNELMREFKNNLKNTREV